MAMYNLDASIIDFARASLNYGLNLGWPVYLSTKNTIMKAYDGRFKDLFQQVFEEEFEEKFKERHLVRTPADRRHGRQFLNGPAAMSGCKNYDATCSPTPWRRVGSLGMMTSQLMTPDGRSSRPRPPMAP